MNFSQEIILENSCVKLVPLQVKHVEHLKKFAIEEPELWTYSLQPITSIVDLEAYIQNALNQRQQGTSYAFLIYDKQKQAYAGSTRFYDYNPRFENITIGYTWIGKEFQKTGLNRQVKFLMLQYAFESMGIKRLEFRADLQNQNSIRAMKSIGCTQEGILRSDGIGGNGKRRDSIVLSILSDEWKTCVKERFVNNLLVNK